MRVAISHTSALQCYRSSCCDTVGGKRRVALPQGFVPQLRQHEARFLEERYGLDLPVHSDVPNNSARRPSQIMSCHILTHATAAPCFIHLGKETYLASPELLAFELKDCLEIASLAFVISELCGDFSLSQKAELGYRTRPPQTNTQAIADFAGDSTSRNIRKFKQALSLSFDNAHSPMELVLALLLSLPPELGGYGLPKPRLNEAVCGYRSTKPASFVATGSAMTGVSYGDLVYEAQRVVAEYISKQHHEGRWDSDALRVNKLLNAGYKTVFISPEQIMNPASSHVVADQLAKQLNAECPARTQEWLERNASLRDELFRISNLRLQP